MVIIKYSDVQTGANIQDGGLKVGLLSNEYQGSLNSIVAILPITDAEYVISFNCVDSAYRFDYDSYC